MVRQVNVDENILFLRQLKGIRFGHGMVAMHGRPPCRDIPLVLPAHFAGTGALMGMMFMSKRVLQANQLPGYAHQTQ